GSRARPRWPIASGRLGVISTSRIVSDPASPVDSTGNPACSSRRRMPSAPPTFPIATVSTNSESQSRENFMASSLRRAPLRRPRELPQEALVPLEEQAQVGEAVVQERDAVDAEAEGEARELLGIERDALEHPRMHHPRAHDLDPTRALALRAARALAEDAAHRDVDPGLDEREERRDEPRVRPLAEELLEERRHGPLQVGHRDPAVDDE